MNGGTNKVMNNECYSVNGSSGMHGRWQVSPEVFTLHANSVYSHLNIC